VTLFGEKGDIGRRKRAQPTGERSEQIWGGGELSVAVRVARPVVGDRRKITHSHEKGKSPKTRYQGSERNKFCVTWGVSSRRQGGATQQGGGGGDVRHIKKPKKRKGEGREKQLNRDIETKEPPRRKRLLLNNLERRGKKKKKKFVGGLPEDFNGMCINAGPTAPDRPTSIRAGFREGHPCLPLPRGEEGGGGSRLCWGGGGENKNGRRKKNCNAVRWGSALERNTGFKVAGCRCLA